MGRPPKAKEEKRQLVSVRFDPIIKELLARAATASSCSLAAEIERRVEAFAGLDAETVSLLEAIGQGIAAIEKSTRKRWHKDLKTWSAVAELLMHGPLRDARPDKPYDDPIATKAWRRLDTLGEKRRSVIAQLAEIGIAVSEEPTGGTGGLQSAISDPRGFAKSRINNIPEPDEKEMAIDLFGQVEELDAQIEAAHTAWIDAIEPYWSAEKEGREAYRERQRAEAKRKRDAGEPFNHLDLLGIFR